jgi:uncharacterized protein YeaO (DUF488 family)
MIHIVRLGGGSKRRGVRLGTVRRPPRGVPKSRWNEYFDVWLPVLSPSAPLVKYALGGGDYQRYARRYRNEMKQREPAQVLDALAALSHVADFSVGCYCEDPSRCHRTLRAELLALRGGRVQRESAARAPR